MNQRTRQSGLTIHATILFFALTVLGGGKLACAQGVATGGTAVPARPLPPGMKAPTVTYEDVAVQAGLTGVEVSGADHGKQYIVESTGTGVAIFDYDNDGLPDILLVNGGRLGDGAQPKPFLYHNLGGLKFEDVTEKAGITRQGGDRASVRVTLIMTATPMCSSPNGDRIFCTAIREMACFATRPKNAVCSRPSRWSTGCAFIDYNRDGYLDLVVVHYIDFDMAHTPAAGEQIAVSAGKD